MKASKEQIKVITTSFDEVRKKFTTEMLIRQNALIETIEEFDFYAIKNLDASLGRELFMDMVRLMMDNLEIEDQTNDILK